MIVIWSVLGVLVVLGAAALLLRPRFEGAVPADVPAAKAAGDALLASRDTTVLVVLAHPDDAEWWSGGTIASLALHNRVVLVLGTSGDKGAGGDVPGLGAIREELQRRGGAKLGYSDYVFLRHPDQGLADAPGYPGEVLDLMRRYRPAAVISFDVESEGPVYHHPDHEAAGRAALAAAQDLGGITLYLQHTAEPDVIVDYAQVKEKKRDAFAILGDYRGANPTWGWLIGPLNGALAGLGGVSYGSKAAFPEVGVEYGEVFRRVAVPAK
jgi:LmbE family N-acetylglucosaminyl deacetylase